MNTKYVGRVKLLLKTALMLLIAQAALTKEAYADNPAMPQGISASVYSTTAAELFWQASTDRDGIGFYRVYIAGTLFRQTPGPSIYIDSLSPDRHYDIQISAVDTRGNESQWTPIFRLQSDGSASSTASTPVVPEQPSNPTDTETTETAVAETVAADSGTDESAASDTAADSNSVNDNSASTEESAASNDSRVGVPQDITAVSRSTTTVDVTWMPESGLAEPFGYNVYLGTSYIATTFNPFYTVKGLDADTSYRIVLTAFDDAGNFSTSSDAVAVQTRLTDEVPVPTNEEILPVDPPDASGTDPVADQDNDPPVVQAPTDDTDAATDSSDSGEEVEEAPVVEAPAEEAPVAEAPAEEAPVAEAPVEEAPVAEAPVEEAPVVEAPAEEAPVVEAPAEEAPVVEAPVEEAVAEVNEPVFSAIDAVIASPSVVGLDDFFGRSLEIDPSVVSAGDIPSTPRNLRANLIGNDWVELNWAPSNDDGEVVAYKIYRDDGVVYELNNGDGSDDVETNTTLINYWDTTTYVDCNFTHVAECHTGLTPEVGARHIYQVTAIDNEGNESTRSQPLDVQLHAASNAELADYVDPYMDGDDRFIFETDLSNPENFIDQFDLVFAEEFTELELDADKWSTSLTFRQEDQNIINGEMQYFVDTQRDPDFGYNPFILNGETLTISAIRTPPELLDRALGQEFLSGALSTHHLRSGQLDDSGQLINDKFATTYGYVEGRIRVGTVSGMLTSFYLFRRWAGEHSPEIDIVEYLGENPFGEEKAFQTYHYNDVSHRRILSSPTMFYPRDEGHFGDLVDLQDFHTFSVLWEPGLVIWYINNQEVQRLSGRQVGRQSMNIILYLVTGSAWAPRPADDAPFPLEIEVDYIRAYKRR